MNREDPEWFWIVRSDGQEGFIPSGFVYPADNILQSNVKSSIQTPYNGNANQQNDIRQLQQQQHQTDVIANNEMNTCQSQNLPIGTAIGHISMQNNTNDSQSAIINNSGNNNNSNNANNPSQQQQSIIGASEDLRYHGTELVMLYDYKVK